MLQSYQWQQLRKRIKQRDGNQCVQCGSTDKLQVDHIIARGMGGDPWDETNLQTLCHLCHKHKTKNDVRFLARNAHPPRFVKNFSPKSDGKDSVKSDIVRIDGDSVFRIGDDQ